MNINVLNPVWSETDDTETIKKILYLEKEYWLPKTWWKVASPSSNPEIKVAVREKFENTKDVGEYLNNLCLKYPKDEFSIKSWRQKEQQKRRVPLFKKKEFLTGFIPKVQDYCERVGIECNVQFTGTKILPDNPIDLPGITPREEQRRLVENAILDQRGYIVSPTGSGKTVLAAWMLNAFSSRKRLFLCHTLSLLTQTHKEFTRFGLKSSMVSGGSKDLSGDIVVSTVQSFIKLPRDVYDLFDVVIVDECHHVGITGIWADVLKDLYCPIRIGLTATPSKSQENKLGLEGYLGPEIDSLSLTEGIERKILVKPKLRIIEIPAIKLKGQTYQQVYDEGIVNNKMRNRIILKTVKEYTEAGKSVLIFVNRIEHGNNLIAMGELFGIPIAFIRGQTEAEQREEIKELLKTKELKCGIATSVWKEGVNIPSLDIVMPAGGGESEIATLQTIGRGLRTFEGKNELLIVDFFDTSSPYFIKHFGKRMSTYCQMGVYE